MMKRCAGVWWWMLAWVPLVHAHDPGLSTAQGAWSPGRLELTTELAPAEAKAFLPREVRPAGRWTAEVFAQARPWLAATAGRLWQLKVNGRRTEPRRVSVRLAGADNLAFDAHYDLPAGAGPRVNLRAMQLTSLPPGHRQFVTMTGAEGEVLVRKLLSVDDADVEFAIPVAGAAAPGANDTGATRSTTGPAGFGGFLTLGIAHIWTGYDHLLFLFALLVVCRSFRSIVAIISCFTLAHSLTLAVATLDLVTLPSRLVEPAIAASIVFVGAENLWRGGEEPRGRGALTFAFGLIHGFGFASVLRELGVGANGGGIAVPLVTFNLGVEIGQIAIAAIVLPVVWWLRQHEGFVRRGVPALSAVVVAAGLYWLLERVTVL